MKIKLIITICALVGLIPNLRSQVISYDIHFQTYNDTIGVFEISNLKDTSIIVGHVNFKDDTLYFKEYSDTLIHLLKTSGANTTIEGVGIPAHVKSKHIGTKFYFLGKKDALVHISAFKYKTDGGVELTYRNDADSDIMHYLPFEPFKFNTIQLTVGVKNYMKASPNLNIPGGKRKGTSHHQEENFDFWLLEYAVFYSNRKFEINLQELTKSNSVARLLYPVVILN